MAMMKRESSEGISGILVFVLTKRLFNEVLTKKVKAAPEGVSESILLMLIVLVLACTNFKFSVAIKSLIFKEKVVSSADLLNALI